MQENRPIYRITIETKKPFRKLQVVNMGHEQREQVLSDKPFHTRGGEIMYHRIEVKRTMEGAMVNSGLYDKEGTNVGNTVLGDADH